MATLADIIVYIGNLIWGWPLIMYMVSASFIATIALKGIQFTYFFESWRLVFGKKARTDSADKHYISPFQAFLNILSSSIGNGSLAGMATAVYSGGPGAGVWIFLFGFLSMAIRFLEVFISLRFARVTDSGVMRGGPMEYLKLVPGRRFLPMLYAVATLFVVFVAGSAVQCNSIRYGIDRIVGFDASYYIAVVLLGFILYSLLGGARRIIAFADAIVPFKVFLFFSATIIALLYHITGIWTALCVIINAAFSYEAFFGGVAGYSVQNALRFGLARSLSATEVGLGTAGILFGTTGKQDPKTAGIMSLSSVVVSNHLVCCSLILLYVVSGVWSSGAQGIAMTSAAYETVFGSFGSIIAAVLSISFGMGVLVTYAYIGREVWAYLTGNRWMFVYNGLYCLMAFFGTLSRVDVVWNAVDIGNAGMMIFAVYGLLWLLPSVRKELV